MLVTSAEERRGRPTLTGDVDDIAHTDGLVVLVLLEVALADAWVAVVLEV